MEDVTSILTEIVYLVGRVLDNDPKNVLTWILNPVNSCI